ncbi:MAG: hypothetical protein R3B49_00785 [Phycisphaerales bacterium]
MDDRDVIPMTEDERYDGAAIAAATERRNRPRHFVVLGAAALGIALLALLFAWTARGTAREQLDARRAEMAQIESLGNELAALRSAKLVRTDDDTLFRTPSDMLTRLSDLASEAGLESEPPVPVERPVNLEAGRRREWPYSVTDPSLDALLAWVRLAVERIPGTFPQTIELRPAGNRWRLDVTFARYERAP